MLKRFFVNNFRNLLNIEFRPTGVNLLVGPNNAGKTNLCHALRFMAVSSVSTLNEGASVVLLENWNITNAYSPDKDVEFQADIETRKDGVDYSFSYLLQLSTEKEEMTGKQMLHVRREKLSVTGGERVNFTLIENNGGESRISNEQTHSQNGESPYLETHVPPESTALSKLFDATKNPLSIWFKQCLGAFHYYNLLPQSMRLPKVLGKSPVMTPDGQNFSKFLFTLHNENPRLERKVIDNLKKVEPKIDLFTFYTPDPEFIHFVFEDKEGHRFSVHTMSDGTLRYLALCCLAVIMEEAPKMQGPPPIVVFEEPENGIYVGHLKPLFSQLDFNMTGGQLFFTSHSPYVIDLFDAHPEGIHLMKPGVPSSSLTKPDLPKVRRLLQDMPLGELHYRELLA